MNKLNKRKGSTIATLITIFAITSSLLLQAGYNHKELNNIEEALKGHPIALHRHKQENNIEEDAMIEEEIPVVIVAQPKIEEVQAITNNYVEHQDKVEETSIVTEQEIKEETVETKQEENPVIVATIQEDEFVNDEIEKEEEIVTTETSGAEVDETDAVESTNEDDTQTTSAETITDDAGEEVVKESTEQESAMQTTTSMESNSSDLMKTMSEMLPLPNCTTATSCSEEIEDLGDFSSVIKYENFDTENIDESNHTSTIGSDNGSSYFYTEDTVDPSIGYVNDLTIPIPE